MRQSLYRMSVPHSCTLALEPEMTDPSHSGSPAAADHRGSPANPASPPSSRAFFPILLITACLGMLVAGSVHTPNFAAGADIFGYLRQEQLFRAKGLLHGLNTHLRHEEVQFLIHTAESLHLPPEQWAEMVAPHAHHYNAKTHAIILQYPPGTGLALSLLPQGRSTESLTAIAVGLMTLGFMLAGARHSLGIIELLALAAVLFVADQLVMDFAGFGCYSVTWTFGLLPLAALAAMRTASGSRTARCVAGAVLGLLCAGLLLTRIPNVFILAGLGLFVLMQAWFESENNLRSATALLIATAVPFFLCGVVPLAIANLVNAGGVSASTYSPADAAPPSFKPVDVWSNAQFYLQSTPAWRALLLSFLVTGCAVAVVFRMRDRSCRRLVTALTCAVSLTFVVNVVYFFSHPVQNPYYMAPGSLFVICFGLFGFIEARSLDSDGPARLSPVGAGLAIVTIATILGVQVLMAPSHPVAVTLPPEVVDPAAIVWADLTSGTTFYYNGKYAAKLGFGSPCVQDRMVEAVYRSGRPQYFIDDTVAVDGIIKRLSRTAHFEPVGTYDTPIPAAIYKLKDLRGPLNCE